eukprot:10090250-Heterocapsa_arctica.AAC.1
MSSWNLARVRASAMVGVAGRKAVGTLVLGIWSARDGISTSWLLGDTEEGTHKYGCALLPSSLTQQL